MTTANTTAQALEVISIPARKGIPRIVSIRPPSGDALPAHTQFHDSQQNHHLKYQRIDNDIQNVSLLRILEHTENLDTQISALKNQIDALENHLPTLKEQRCFHIICRIFKDVEQVPKKIKKQVTEARYKIPKDRWFLEPENSDTSSSEWAPSDYGQKQDDPEVAESFDQHGSSAPFSSTSGSGHMGEGEASLSECSETVPSEFCTSDNTPSLLKHFNTIGKGITTQTVCPIPKNLQAIRRQLQRLPKMPRSGKHEFKKPIADLRTLFENLEMSNDTYNLSIRDLRLHLCHCLSFKLPGVSSGFGLLDEVDDEHPLPDSNSGSSTSTRVLKLLEDRYQTSYKELDLMVTQSLQILKSWLRENNVTNPQELSTLIGKAQDLQGRQHQNVLHMISIVCHQHLMKWAEESSNYHKRKLEEAVEQGYAFALLPESENSETGDAYILV